MSEFFRELNCIAGQKRRATMSYLSQANGTAEIMLQTLTRAIKMYITDTKSKSWYKYAKRLNIAINKGQDRVRGHTPFYLIHGWDPRSTLEASLPLGSTKRRDREIRRWGFNIQRHNQRARKFVNDRRRIAIQDQAYRHSTEERSQEVEVESQVWLCLDQMNAGYV